MNKLQKITGLAAIILSLSANAAIAKKHSSEVNGITYHINSHTMVRPDDIQAYRGYGVDVTDIQITDGYLKVYARTYQDRPNTVYILGAKEPKDKNLRPLVFPNMIINLRELFGHQGITKVCLNKKRVYK